MPRVSSRLRARIHTRTGVRLIVLLALVACAVNLSLIRNTQGEWSAMVPGAVNNSVVRRAMLRRTRRTVARALRFAVAEPKEGILRPAATSVPFFGQATFPVDRVPDWGAMTTPEEWDRSFGQMRENDFVPVPAYDLPTLTIPLATLEDRGSAEETAALTAKLFYSTRYFGSYDLDAGEFTGQHSGVDLKLAAGTPVAAIGGGIVRFAAEDAGGLGLHVIIEHAVDGERFFSIYGHLGSIAVQSGDTVTAGQVIGTVGMTGNTTGAHLHLQVDRDTGTDPHVPYVPLFVPTPADVARWSANPIRFIESHS